MSSRRDGARENLFDAQGNIAEELSVIVGLSGTAPEFWCSAGTGPEVFKETTGSLLEISTVMSLIRSGGEGSFSGESSVSVEGVFSAGEW